MSKVSKGQFGWISNLRDYIKYKFSKPTTKSTGKRQYNQKLDSNGRLLVNNNYVVPGYRFVDLNGNTFRVNNNGKPQLEKANGSNKFSKTSKSKYNGWDNKDQNSRIAVGAALNPSWRMSNPLHLIKGAMAVPINKIAMSTIKMPLLVNRSGSTQDDRDMWAAYLGFENKLPTNDVRFTGDRNKDNKTYVGLSQETKNFIRSAIESGDLKVNQDGSWTQVKEFGADYPNSKKYHASHLENYAIRQNNNSGIYDVFDTYDFPGYIPIANRKKGQELEIRDTIWTNKANPQIYKTNFTTTSKLKR